MTSRTFAGITACALLVPVLSAWPMRPAPRGSQWRAGGAAMASPSLELAQQAPAAAALPVRAARIERRDAARGLADAVAAIQREDGGPIWIAWSVPAGNRKSDGRRPGADDRGRCVLEDDGSFSHSGASMSGSARRIVMLVRSESSALTRVAFTDERCTVDAGARTVYWLEGVVPAQSVSLMAGLVSQEPAGAGEDDRDAHGKRSPGRQALVALALHAEASVDTALAGFVEPGQPRWLRRDAAFWLGAARGAAGVAIIDRLAREDRDDEFREHLTFVLTLVGERGIDTLIDLARRDSSPAVRGQALFWLGQKAGERAVSTLTRALDDDPDREVRKKAVFALSQLPKDEGVPKLISVARTHRDPEVRKQAMFWLGQSGDDRALGFFEEVLRQ